MRTNDVVTKAHKIGFMIVLVSHSFNGRDTVRFKGYDLTQEGAEHFRELLFSKLPSGGEGADYRVLGPRQLASLLKTIQGQQAARRAKGAKKAAATRAKTPKDQRFVCCPTCGAKSKKLYSEMGGLQTRKCQRGHTFEYDKWIADRAFWGPIVGSGPVPESAIKRPVKL
jgi:hypothetical protein